MSASTEDQGQVAKVMARLRLALAGILMLRLLLAIPAFLDPLLPKQADGFGYLSLATSLATGGGYSGGPGSDLDLFRTPAYPVALAACMRLFGPSTGPMIVMHQVVVGLTCLGLVKVGRAAGCRGLGQVAAFLFALMPNPALWSMLLLTETLFAACVVLTLLAAVAHLRSGSMRTGFLVGSAIGFSALVRPIGLMLLLAAVGAEVLAIWRGRSLKQVGREFATVLLISLGITLLWSTRNFFKWGYFGLSPVHQAILTQYVGPETLARGQGIPLEDADRLINGPGDGTPSQRALRAIREYPSAFLSGYMRGTAAMLLGYGRESLQPILGKPYEASAALASLREGRWRDALAQVVAGLRETEARRSLTVMLALMTCQVMIYLAAVRGAIILASAEKTGRPFLILILLTMAALMLPVGHVGLSRFRVPVEPLIALLAAGGCCRSHARAKAR